MRNDCTVGILSAKAPLAKPQALSSPLQSEPNQHADGSAATHQASHLTVGAINGSLSQMSYSAVEMSALNMIDSARRYQIKRSTPGSVSDKRTNC